MGNYDNSIIAVTTSPQLAAEFQELLIYRKEIIRVLC
jgi:hypothetical protein